MTQEFVSYELSLEMKQIGFNEPCFGLFVSMNNELLIKEMPNQQESEQYFGGILAPTFSQCFRFFRDKYFIYCEICRYYDTWDYDIYDFKSGNEYIPKCFKPFNTYEEAELAAIVKLIEIVKENKK